MQKLLLILFGIWFILGDSCIVKAEVIQLFVDGQLEEVSLGHPEAKKAISSGQTDGELCQEVSHATLDLSGINFSLSDLSLNSGLSFYFASAFFLSLLLFPGIRKEGNSYPYIPNPGKAPLYIRFLRLQFYA